MLMPIPPDSPQNSARQLATPARPTNTNSRNDTRHDRSDRPDTLYLDWRINFAEMHALPRRFGKRGALRPAVAFSDPRVALEVRSRHISSTNTARRIFAATAHLIPLVYCRPRDIVRVGVGDLPQPREWNAKHTCCTNLATDNDGTVAAREFKGLEGGGGDRDGG